MLLSAAIILAVILAPVGSVKSYAEGSESIDMHTMIESDYALDPNHVSNAIMLEGGDVTQGGNTAVERKEHTNYVSFRGKIENITRGSEDVVGNYVMLNSGESMMRVHVGDEVMLFETEEGKRINIDELQEGKDAIIFYSETTIMGMSNPPVITPSVLVQYSEGSNMQVVLNHFDSEFLAYDDSLKLNISEETKISDTNGNEKESQDLKNQKLLVFYDRETRSIPPQTSPVKVYLLNDEKSEVDYRDEVVGEVEESIQDVEMYERNRRRMIPLAEEARNYNYEVKWIADEAAVELRNSSNFFRIEIGNPIIEHNGLKIALTVAPQIIDEKTYVPGEFFNLFGEV